MNLSAGHRPFSSASHAAPGSGAPELVSLRLDKIAVIAVVGHRFFSLFEDFLKPGNPRFFRRGYERISIHSPQEVTKPYLIMKIRATLFCLLSFSLLQPSAFPQGPLPPPGAPAPTMKTLQQIEPRIDLQVLYDQNHDGVGDDANYEIVISAPGSYYLSSNLGITGSPSVTRPNAIFVGAQGVVIDLNGFTILRTSGSGGRGIDIAHYADRCTVKNGSISEFAYGVFVQSQGSEHGRAGSCIQVTVSGCTSAGLDLGDSWEISGCKATGNPGNGIVAGPNSTLTNCTAIYSQGSAGIAADTGSTLTNCTALYSQGGYGISAGSGSTLSNCAASYTDGIGIFAGIGSAMNNCAASFNFSGVAGIVAQGSCSLTNCSAFLNTGSSPSSCGISAGDGSTLSNCTASNNTSTLTATNSTGIGIEAGPYSTIHHCTAISNKGDGIQVQYACVVTDSNCYGNGSGTTGSGIATDIRASISGCTAGANKADGIVFNGDSFVLNNHASANGGAGFHDVGSASRIDGNVSRENIGIGILANAIDTVVRNNSGANGNGTPSNQYGPTAGANWGPVGTANNSTSPWANF